MFLAHDANKCKSCAHVPTFLDDQTDLRRLTLYHIVRPQSVLYSLHRNEFSKKSGKIFKKGS